MNFNIKKFSTFLLAVMLLTLSLLGCQKAEITSSDNNSSETKVLKIGATPGEDVQKRQEEFKPFIEYLENKTGMKAELFVATDYASVVEAMRAGKVDVATFGPLSYVLAADVAEAEVFATEERKGLGRFYESYIIAHPDSDIEEITDLKGKSFAFVDPASTGGHLIPKKDMIKNGIDPDKDLKSVVFAGAHDACAMAVKNKNVDAASIVKHQYEKLIEKGLITDKDVKIIYTSDPFPASAWAFRKDLDEDTREKVQDAVLNIPEDEMESLKGFMGSTLKYVPAEDSDWDCLRETAKLINLDLTKQ